MLPEYLRASERALLIKLAALDCSPRGCFAYRATLAGMIGYSVFTINQDVVRLKKRGLITVTTAGRPRDDAAAVRVTPAGRGAANRIQAEYKQSATYKEEYRYLKHPVTTCAEIPDPVPPESVQQAAVVVPKPQTQISEPTSEDPAHRMPKELPSPERLPSAAASNPTPVAVEDMPDTALSAVAALQDAGVARGAALRMALAYPASQIQAAIAYTKGYRSEVLNAPGLIRFLLESGSKIPGWAYRQNSEQLPGVLPASDALTRRIIEGYQEKKGGESISGSGALQEADGRSLKAELPRSEAWATPPAGTGPEKGRYADVWKKALSVMASGDALEAWAPPLQVAALSESVYIADITPEICILAASSSFQADTVCRYRGEIRYALGLAGVRVPRLEVEVSGDALERGSDLMLEHIPWEIEE